MYTVGFGPATAAAAAAVEVEVEESFFFDAVEGESSVGPGILPMPA